MLEGKHAPSTVQAESPRLRRQRRLVARREDYTNEKHSRDRPDDFSDLRGLAKEDRIESRKLARECDGSATHPTDECWHTSLAYAALQPSAENTGIWIPKWVGKGLRNARLARVMSWVLWWFDDDSTTSMHSGRGPESTGPSRCRAQARDDRGVRVLATSFRRLAAEVNIDRRTVARILERLERRRLIRVRRPTSGKHAGSLLINPVPMSVARLYWNQTGDMEAYGELLDRQSRYRRVARMTREEREQEYRRLLEKAEKRDARPPAHPTVRLNDWWATKTRRLACDRKQGGVFVPDLVLAACEGEIAESWLLSQALWWFGVTTDTWGRTSTRTKIIRHNYRWMAKSDRQWEQELGLSRSSVRNAPDSLVNKRRFLILKQWPVHRRRDFGRRTNHIRPNTPVLEEILLAHRTLDAALEFAERRQGSW